MATIEEKKAQIIELQGKNNNANIVWGSVSLLGSIGGVVLAHKMGYKFWGKVGFFFLGGMVTGLPMRLIYANKMSERAAKISLLRNEIWDEESGLIKQQVLQEVNNHNAQIDADKIAFEIKKIEGFLATSKVSPTIKVSKEREIQALKQGLYELGFSYKDGRAVKLNTGGNTPK
jgi:hypothetical protein